MITSQGISFLIAAIVGFLFFGYLVFFITRKPQNSQKWLDYLQQIPGAFWTRHAGAGGLMLVMIFVLFLFFTCMLGFALYGLFLGAS